MQYPTGCQEIEERVREGFGLDSAAVPEEKPAEEAKEKKAKAAAEK